MYVPDLNRNLISMGDLDDIGLQARLGNDLLKVLLLYSREPRETTYVSLELM